MLRIKADFYWPKTIKEPKTNRTLGVKYISTFKNKRNKLVVFVLATDNKMYYWFAENAREASNPKQVFGPYRSTEEINRAANK